MDLAIFADSPFDDRNAMNDFFLANYQSHSQIAKALEQQGSPISSQPIGDMANEKDWLEIHQEMHAEELAILGLGEIGVDLSNVDLKDESQYHDWMLQHAFIHTIVNGALGLV